MDVLGDFPEAPGEVAGGPAFEVAIYVIVSMIVLVGIAYLIGKTFSNRKLEEWAKNEFLQVFISAALVGGLFFLMAPGTGLITMAFNSLVPADAFSLPSPIPDVTVSVAQCSSEGIGLTDGTAICYAYGYLGYLAMQIMNLMAMIFSINMLLDILSKIAIDVIVVEITPLSGLSSVVQVFNSILQSLLFLGIVVEAERALLIFVDRVALQIFLPIGIVLRTFFGTRRLGGALIAIAIGAYLVFPLTISLNGIVVEEVTRNAYEDLWGPLESLNSQVDSADPMSSSELSGEGDMLSPDSWTSPLENLSETAGAIMDTIKKIPQLMMTMLSLLVVQVVFLPVLSMVLTMIAIKELAALFGSEINLSRFEV